ncbi:MAG: flagellar motor switch protein FliN [Pseudomonadota bacterium]|mgnify:CR=1 FL=1
MSETQASQTEADETGAPDATGDEKYAPDALNAADQPAAGADVNLDLILDVKVSLALHVGSTQITIRDLVSLAEGSVVALDRAAGEPLDVMVNGTLVAHGEIVVVDGQFGVRLTDVISPAERIETLG